MGDRNEITELEARALARAAALPEWVKQKSQRPRPFDDPLNHLGSMDNPRLAVGEDWAWADAAFAKTQISHKELYQKVVILTGWRLKAMRVLLRLVTGKWPELPVKVRI